MVNAFYICIGLIHIMRALSYPGRNSIQHVCTDLAVRHYNNNSKKICLFGLSPIILYFPPFLKIHSLGSKNYRSLTTSLAEQTGNQSDPNGRSRYWAPSCRRSLVLMRTRAAGHHSRPIYQDGTSTFCHLSEQTRRQNFVAHSFPSRWHFSVEIFFCKEHF